MKQLLLLLLMVLQLNASAQSSSSIKKKTNTKRKASTHSTVKTTPPGSNTSTKYNISGKILQVGSYCGGAAPSEEMLEEMRKPFPYPTKTLHVRKGTANNSKMPILADIHPDKDGNYNIQLPAGTYCVIVDEQVDALDLNQYNQPANAYLNADLECLKDWWSKPYYLLVVKNKDITGLDFSFQRRCFCDSDIPCLNYSGPMPP